MTVNFIERNIFSILHMICNVINCYCNNIICTFERGLQQFYMRSFKVHHCRNGTILGITAMLVLLSGKMVHAEENTSDHLSDDTMVRYSVSFVDADDENHIIFHTQDGEVSEGTSLKVSFPEQIIGSDGHIWKSAVSSPQLFELYGTGTEKIYIEYEKGRLVPEIEDDEDANMVELKKRLKRWEQTAWEAECAIFSRQDDDTSVKRPNMLILSTSENDARIRNLVSAVGDSLWHEFYLIGQDYIPSAKCIGVEYDAIYSEMEEDSFLIDGKEYFIMRIRVKRNWDSNSCTHQWSQTELAENNCLKNGKATYVCERCQREKTELLPALGHLDENEDMICDRCASDNLSEPSEKVIWKEGDVQLRNIGGKILSFTCIDDDYHDWQNGHRKAALFLCDHVIRSDVDTVPGENMKIFSFGKNNNYKTSDVRAWLKENSHNSSFNLEPIHTGIETAYTGSTAQGEFSQVSERDLTCHDIGFQLMNDELFCLSVEEALAYREVLWKFDSDEDNPQTQVSSYSQGYYLRTPFYFEDDAGKFVYNQRIYGVDLINGCLRPVGTDSETYGIRPAFALPQM